MRIPVGDFGFKVPELAGAPSVPVVPFAGAGFKELAATGMHAAQMMGEREIQIAREARRAEAMNIHAQAQNALAEEHDRLREGVLTGQVPVDEAPKIWADSSQKIVDEHLKSVDRSNVGLVQAGLAGNVGHFGRSINQAITARNISTVGAGLNDYLEQMDRFALSDFDAAKKQGVMAIDSQGPLAGHNPEQVGKLRQGFVERISFNRASADLNASMDDMGKLREFLDQLPKMPDLDPGKRNILESKTLHMIDRLEAKGLRAEASRLATVQAQVGAVDSMILKGFSPNEQTMATLQAAAKGTPYEQTVAQQIEFSRQTAGFRVAPPIEQEKFINQLEAQVRANPTPAGVQTLERMKAINKAQDEEIKKDPMSYAAQNGLASVQPLDFSQPLGDQLAARADIARGMKSRYRAPLKLITEQEAQLVADTLKGLQPAQKAAQLHDLTAKIGDPEAIREMAGQLAPKDKSLAVGMMLAARDMQAGNGRTVAELYFKGEQALKDKTAKIDDKAEFGIRAEIAKALDGVYTTPEGAHTALEASLHVYAGLKTEGTDNIERAMQLVTGGVVKHNGGKIALPYSYGGQGWFDSRFKDAIAKVSAEDLQRMGGGDEFHAGKATFTAEQLRSQIPGARLQTVGDGQYAIQSDAGYVRLPNGKTFILDMTSPGAVGFAKEPQTEGGATAQIVTSRDKTVDRERKQKKAP